MICLSCAVGASGFAYHGVLCLSGRATTVVIPDQLLATSGNVLYDPSLHYDAHLSVHGDFSVHGSCAPDDGVHHHLVFTLLHRLLSVQEF